jgi:hypothetical protein
VCEVTGLQDQDNVHRDAACFWYVNEIAGVTMVLEILINVSRFSGKLKYKYFCTDTKKSVPQKGNTNSIFLFLVKLYQFICIIKSVTIF